MTPMEAAARALHRHNNEQLAKALRPDEAAKRLAERWEDLHPQAQEAMLEMTRVAVDAHRDASGIR